jgi:hypothetical protein
VAVQSVAFFRCSSSTNVILSLSLSYALGTFFSLQTENLQTVAEFQLNQLTAASPGWAITPLNIDMDSRYGP